MQLLITTAIIALVGSFARADTPHPTPEEASQVKEYNQALVCVGLAEIIWQLEKDKRTAAPIKDVGMNCELCDRAVQEDLVTG
jgi:hypothetical protein